MSRNVIGIFLIVKGITLIICILLLLIKKNELESFYSLLSTELLLDFI